MRRSAVATVIFMSELAAPDGQDRRPVYVQIAQDIRSRIESGELRSGTRLRSERDLAEFYGVAYGTIRRTMKALREAGLIETVHGHGTFVC